MEQNFGEKYTLMIVAIMRPSELPVTCDLFRSFPAKLAVEADITGIQLLVRGPLTGTR
jgi:hypothetical protein